MAKLPQDRTIDEQAEAVARKAGLITEEGKNAVHAAAQSIASKFRSDAEDQGEDYVDPDLPNVKIKRALGRVPAPMVAAAGTRELPAAAAAALMRRKQADRAAAKPGGPKDWADKISYVECSDSDCLGPGIWIEGDPLVNLTADNWFSSYKAKGMDWPYEAKPYCQCCLETRKKRISLRVDFQTIGIPGPGESRVGLIANPRFVRTIERSEYEEAIQETAAAAK